MTITQLYCLASERPPDAGERMESFEEVQSALAVRADRDAAWNAD